MDSERLAIIITVSLAVLSIIFVGIYISYESDKNPTPTLSPADRLSNASQYYADQQKKGR